jgi:hypothetical protein
MALTRVDVEDIAGTAEPLAGGFVFEAAPIRIRLIGPENPFGRGTS